jgi:hypothetical protein
MKLTSKAKSDAGRGGAAEQLAEQCSALRRQGEAVQSLGNQGPSSFVRLCQTIFYKKIMELTPMNSNRFR